MKKITFLILTFIFLISCSDEAKLSKQVSSLKNEVDSLEILLDRYSEEITQLKNTPDQRFIRANKFQNSDSLEFAKLELEDIIKNFPGTEYEKKANIQLSQVEKLIERQIKNEELKKSLGFRSLKEQSNISFDDLTLKFEKIWKGNQWVFDDYGDKYFFRDAKRGNSHVMSRVSITSKSNNPLLPAIAVYKLRDDFLYNIGTHHYKFRRWEDYGSYLGNNADYGNDFAHSEKIPFNTGVEIENDELEDSDIFVVLHKKGCFKRQKTSYGNPEINYSNYYCEPKKVLRLDDFDEDYVLLKIL